MSKGPAAREGGELTVLAAGTTLEGKLRCPGAVQLEGSVFGTVTARAVAVGAQGGVLGEVHAEQLSVFGTILGLSFARTRLRVARGGLIRGHARYAELEVERGGRIEGSALSALGEAEAEVFLRLREAAAQ